MGELIPGLELEPTSNERASQYEFSQVFWQIRAALKLDGELWRDEHVDSEIPLQRFFRADFQAYLEPFDLVHVAYFPANSKVSKANSYDVIQIEGQIKEPRQNLCALFDLRHELSGGFIYGSYTSYRSPENSESHSSRHRDIKPSGLSWLLNFTNLASRDSH